jgi:hypothetical protein
MKNLILVLVIWYLTPAFAIASLPERGESVMIKSAESKEQASLGQSPGTMKKPKNKEHASNEVIDQGQKSPERIKMTFSSMEVPSGNLPSYLKVGNRSGREGDSQVYIAQKPVNLLKEVRPGEMFRAVIEQEITASSSVPTPIRAQVLDGALKGEYFVGEATLDRELKRILINFTKIRRKNGTLYSVRAAGLSEKGSVGIEGEYHSEIGKFFLGEIASATAAGVLDSTINRNQTNFGTYVQEPSLANSAKTGAVTALSKTADHFADGAKQAPEYTKSPGYQEIKIIVTEDPSEISGG